MKINKKNLEILIKEEISKMMNKENIEGIPDNKVFSTEEAIPVLISAIEKLKERVSKLEKNNLKEL